jgi:hypothetical protein
LIRFGLLPLNGSIIFQQGGGVSCASEILRLVAALRDQIEVETDAQLAKAMMICRDCLPWATVMSAVPKLKRLPSNE